MCHLAIGHPKDGVVGEKFYAYIELTTRGVVDGRAVLLELSPLTEPPGLEVTELLTPRLRELGGLLSVALVVLTVA